MHAKSIRIPDDMLEAIAMVEQRERIEESTAIRKLIRTGLETYMARLYQHGHVSLREVADRLGLDLIAATNLLLDFGIGGNLDADDVLRSMDHFEL